MNLINNKKENSLGQTYWIYFKRNYLIVSIVTGIMILMCIIYSIIDNEFSLPYYGAISFLILINILTICISKYQYNKEI